MSDLNLFAETDERPGRKTKLPNPFFDAVTMLADNPDKTLTFDLKHLTIEDDPKETMDRVTDRARRYLTEAGDKENVTIEMRKKDGDPNVIIFWATQKRVTKPRKNK